MCTECLRDRKQDVYTGKSEKVHSTFWKCSKPRQSVWQQRAEPSLLKQDPRVLQATTPSSNRKVKAERSSRWNSSGLEISPTPLVNTVSQSMIPNTGQRQASNNAQGSDVPSRHVPISYMSWGLFSTGRVVVSDKLATALHKPSWNTLCN